jgi:uncharacterized OB-fold protein
VQTGLVQTMNETNRTRGWIDGERAIVFQRCETCAHSWYFWRTFCPNCGASEPESLKASGSGQVYALSMVRRPPSQELRAHVPYLIVLVDADEGFRLMAHGESSLTIGDRVQARFVEFGPRLMPFFGRTSVSD